MKNIKPIISLLCAVMFSFSPAGAFWDTVQVSDINVNSAPVAKEVSGETFANVMIELPLSVTDKDGDAVLLKLIDLPKLGTASITGNSLQYTPLEGKTDIEPLVIEAVKELVSDKYFAKEIEKRIGIQIDTTAIDKELENYESKLKEVDLNKARLEREIDNLPVDARYRERKLHDMTLRLDGLYDTIVELEERIEDAKLRRSSIEMEAITLDNIYKIMLNFGKLYDRISDEEKKSIITYLIKEIQIYPNGESEMPLRSIEFNFPIYRNGREIRRLLWEKGNTVETVVLLSQPKPEAASVTASEG